MKKQVKINYLFVLLSVLAIVLIAFLLFGFSYYKDLNKTEVKDNNIENFAEKVVVADYNDLVTVMYELKVDGNIIDSSFDRNQPYSFVVGSKSTIKGFSDGVLGMQEGEERTFIVEPKDGYGTADDFKDVNQSLTHVMMYVKQQTGKTLDANQLIGLKLYTPSQVCIFSDYNAELDLAKLKCQSKLAGKYLEFRVKMLKIEKK